MRHTRLLVMLIAVGMLVALAAPVSAAPADGNGNKSVEVLVGGGVLECGEGDLDVHVEGWEQGKEFNGEGNRNLGLTVFHLDVTYTNSEGDTWVWRDRGPDRVYFDGEFFFLAISGRAGANNIGHLVVNLDTFEIVLQAGQTPFGGEPFEGSPDDFACETLVG